jgi:hypothetical protein
LAEAVRKYHIPDFSNWKSLRTATNAAFERAFARLEKRFAHVNRAEIVLKKKSFGLKRTRSLKPAEKVFRHIAVKCLGTR